MGGGGGDTTNVTNTGLGDDQYQTLADNQVGISGQITDARDDATARYDNFDTRFDGIDSSVAGVGSNLTAGFTNIQDLMDQYNTGMNTQFDTVNTGIGTNNTAIGANATSLNNLSTDVSGGFNDMSGRFDTVDTGQANIQGAVDQGFVDQAQGFADAQADRTAQFDAANTAMNTGFENTDAAVQEGFGEAATQLTNTQANVLDGQGQLQTNLDTMSDTADTYAAQSLENQAALQQGQDGFVTSFDNYTERYGEDQELAQQSRADLATAQANQTDRLREDLGAYAQATATGQANLGTQLGDVATGVGAEFQNLGTAVEGGFSQAGTDALAQQENLTTRLGNLGNIMTTTGANIDENTKQQYEALSSSFDENGQLIQNSIAENGDTISRQMDDQGNIIATRFDQSGNQVDQVNMNVNEMLTQAESYQRDLTGQIQGVGDGLMSGQADLTQQVMQNQTTTNNAVTDVQQAMANGFQNLDGGQVAQARDLAKIAAAQTDLDMTMRQDFNQLGAAFSDNGQLIKNSIDEQGNTISRAMDNQGNLLLRSFDVTGKQIGNKVININRSLDSLSKLQTMQGGNASMGNLSPAMSAAVPSTGFASPFATTGTPKPNMERPPNPFLGTIPVSQPINPNTFTR